LPSVHQDRILGIHLGLVFGVESEEPGLDLGKKTGEKQDSHAHPLKRVVFLDFQPGRLGYPQTETQELQNQIHHHHPSHGPARAETSHLPLAQIVKHGEGQNLQIQVQTPEALFLQVKMLDRCAPQQLVIHVIIPLLEFKRVEPLPYLRFMAQLVEILFLKGAIGHQLHLQL